MAGGDGSAGPVTSPLLEALLDTQYARFRTNSAWMRLVDIDGEA
jgi:branched-chain amino acid aminotransferase